MNDARCIPDPENPENPVIREPDPENPEHPEKAHFLAAKPWKRLFFLTLKKSINVHQCSSSDIPQTHILEYWKFINCILKQKDKKNFWSISDL